MAIKKVQIPLYTYTIQETIEDRFVNLDNISDTVRKVINTMDRSERYKHTRIPDAVFHNRMDTIHFITVDAMRNIVSTSRIAEELSSYRNSDSVKNIYKELKKAKEAVLNGEEIYTFVAATLVSVVVVYDKNSIKRIIKELKHLFPVVCTNPICSWWFKPGQYDGP